MIYSLLSYKYVLSITLSKDQITVFTYLHFFPSNSSSQILFVFLIGQDHIQSSIIGQLESLNIKELQLMQKQEQVVAQLPTKELSFKEYPSLELSTMAKFINYIRESGFAAPEIAWVASEKIHGSNFSIHFNGETVRYGRRTDFLSSDIPVPCNNPGQYFNESFYNAHNLVSRFHNRLPEVFAKIKNVDPEVLKFAIYGEFFGGNWPINHPQGVKKGPKGVQRGIYYTPNHQFYAFDIFVTNSQSAYWVDVLDIPQLLKGIIYSVPVYCKGTFDEVFAVNIQIDSTIPELLGFQRLEKNLIEGMVIRPNHNLKNENSERVIIKKKNKEFAEKASQTDRAKKEKKERVIDPDIAPILEQLIKYVNHNRVDSFYSKFPDLKDRKKAQELIVKDILADAEKDEVNMILDQEKMKELLKQFSNGVIREINAYFTSH